MGPLLLRSPSSLPAPGGCEPCHAVTGLPQASGTAFPLAEFEPVSRHWPASRYCPIVAQVARVACLGWSLLQSRLLPGRHQGDTWRRSVFCHCRCLPLLLLLLLLLGRLHPECGTISSA